MSIVYNKLHVSCHLLARVWVQKIYYRNIVRHTSNIKGYIVQDFIMNSGERKRKGTPDGILKHVKYKERLGGNLPPPGVIDVQVVGTSAGGTPRAIAVNTTSYKYLFNCGEGTQRACVEQKVKLSRIEHILITHKSWNNIGGMLGMALSMEAMNVPRVTVHGSTGVENVVKSSRGFGQLHRIDIEKRDISEEPFEDGTMKMHTVPIYPTLKETQKNSEEEPEIKRQKMSAQDEESLESIVYICELFPKPRKIDFEKCVDLEIPSGPLIGVLKNGEEITLEDGRKIVPDDVLEPAEDPKTFMVIECPDSSYISSLLGNERIKDIKNKMQTELVIHLSSQDIIEDSNYQEWMKRFPEKTCHLVLNETSSSLCFESPHKAQTMLNLVSNDIFPLLPKEEDTKNDFADGKVLKAIAGLKYHLRPSKGLDREPCLRIEPESYIKEAYEQEGLENNLKLLQEKLKDIPTKGPLTAKDKFPEIVFLGTGSSIPNKVRNVSAILVHLSSDQCMLMDCGEDTYGQIHRHYGTKTADILLHLSTVYISHLHADHHMGLFGVLFKRKDAFKAAGIEYKPLKILATGVMRDWLISSDQSIAKLNHLIDLIPLEEIKAQNEEGLHTKEIKSVFQGLGLKELETVRMRHRQFPFGIVMRHEEGWSLAYSGDTMPCDAFIQAGKDCDILIHEATMEDDLEEEAAIKKHSTISQAINVGLKMNAKFTLLTHFSQRYAKIPFFNEETGGRVGITFDNMRVRPCDLELLPSFIPTLKAMFADEYVTMEGKTQKKLNQKAKAKSKGKKEETSGNTTSNKGQNKNRKPSPTRLDSKDTEKVANTGT